MKKLIQVKGMSCAHCVMHVTEALKEVPGVTGVVVSLEDGTATVDTNAPVTNEALAAAIIDVGYTPGPVMDL
ncbi:heavy-metal-associated domain-containing protein [Candidatus Cryosericum odellii]|jgi:Cu+-exporting ATPase|uniref:Heavy-metal-associated domain-containing protein n=1 Tax=Candidatus Cryosericum odellii TaxID=2290917 RepID=A0A398DNI0_9BACT|nr:heavy metal-associated domain-containing protein [Candidatus Cryosericum odellii]RIE09613.1 heavy-metal-associated domain-containing protein [Candidatus Cryosericum odellii]RIE13708.1 heavy-metal-associated domain-containing protein [Candidatus Cryosericum odellii]